MPTSEPVGPLSPLASPAPVRSAAKTESPADGANGSPQPSQGFLASLRKAQRGGPDNARPASQSEVADQVVAPEDQPAQDATVIAAGDTIPAATVPAAAAVENALVAQAAIQTAADEALRVAAAASVALEVPVAPTAVDATDATPPATLPDVADNLSRPVPAANAPSSTRPASPMPALLQDWLSVKPTPGPQPATAAPATEEPVESSLDSEQSSSGSTAPMPPGLQIALSAVIAAQAAAQPVLSARIAAADSRIQGRSETAVLSPAVAGAPGNVPPSVADPTQISGTNELTAPLPELPPVPTPPASVTIPAPVVDASPADEVEAAVATAKEAIPVIPPDQHAPDTSAASLAVTAAVPVAVPADRPAVAQPDSLRVTPATAAESLSPPVTTASPATQAEGSVSSDATSAMTASQPSARAAPQTSDDLQSVAAGTIPSAAQPVDDIAEEAAPATVAARDPVDRPPVDRPDLSPLSATRMGSSAEAPPVAQVAPHDPQVFVDRVSQLVLQAHDSGQQLSLQITPPDLGTVRIEVHSHGGILTARLEADSTAARQLLTEHLPQLREALQQQGATVERIDVYQSDHSGPGEGLTDSGWQSSQHDGRNDAAPLLYDEEEAAVAEPADARGSLALGELNIRI